MSNALDSQVAITPSGEEEAMRVTQMSPARKMLARLQFRQSDTAANLIRHVGLDEQQGRRLLNGLLKRRLIRLEE